MPLEVVGEHAQEDVSPHVVLGAMNGRPHQHVHPFKQRRSSWPVFTKARIVWLRSEAIRPKPGCSLSFSIWAWVSIPRSPTITTRVSEKRLRSFSTWSLAVVGSPVLPG